MLQYLREFTTVAYAIEKSSASERRRARAASQAETNATLLCSAILSSAVSVTLLALPMRFQYGFSIDRPIVFGVIIVVVALFVARSAAAPIRDRSGNYPQTVSSRDRLLHHLHYWGWVALTVVLAPLSGAMSRLRALGEVTDAQISALLWRAALVFAFLTLVDIALVHSAAKNSPVNAPRSRLEERGGTCRHLLMLVLSATALCAVYMRGSAQWLAGLAFSVGLALLLLMTIGWSRRLPE